ncbi:helix-turn-helix transcriptional regulator [Pandoraea sp. B-6]|uniref:helix-turn-helix domain-containing protein n=1 Tax=Pandoraea sp. B-6 TaxID=1204340 RepID=UPI00034A1851|nr:helix-turn-helix transcriptional regulator [Pandoraea sp. B-6]
MANNITSDLLRRARRTIGVTQAKLAADTGVNATLIKHFETFRISSLPESTQDALTAYFKQKGLDLDALAVQPAYAANTDVLQQVPRALDLSEPLCFRVSNALTDDQIGVLLDRMSENDEAISEIIGEETKSGLFGHSEETQDASRRLFYLLAENYLIFRNLQGRNLFDDVDISSDRETHGHLLHATVMKSPIASAMTDSAATNPAKDNARNTDSETPPGGISKKVASASAPENEVRANRGA